jgi:ribose transport system substrate-binding protein
MSDLVVRYPKFDAVYCQNDSEAIGAIEVLRIHNIHVPVAGMDGIKEGLQNIMAGKQVVSHLTIPGYQAGWAMAQIFDAYNGWKPTVPERMVFTGSILITKENAAHYYELVYKAPKLPFDWPKMSKILHPHDWDPQNTIIPIDPFRYWGPPPAGTPTAALYQHAKKSGQFAAVTTMYASHFKRKL